MDTRAGGVAATARRRAVPAVLDKHLALTLSVIAFIVTSSKLLAVAHGDMQTVLAILSIRGWTSIPSILLAMLPMLIVTAMGASLINLAEGVRERDELGTLPWVPAVLVTASVLVGPRQWVIAAGGFGLVMIGLSYAWRPFLRTSENRSQRFSFAGLLFVATSAGLIAAMASPRPWLPMEQLQLSQAPPVTGYVLGIESNMTAVLVDATRQVRWLPTAEVVGRHTCSSSDADRAFLPSFIWPARLDNAPCVVGKKKD